MISIMQREIRITITDMDNVKVENVKTESAKVDDVKEKAKKWKEGDLVRIKGTTKIYQIGRCNGGRKGEAYWQMRDTVSSVFIGQICEIYFVDPEDTSDGVIKKKKLIDFALKLLGLDDESELTPDQENIIQEYLDY